MRYLLTTTAKIALIYHSPKKFPTFLFDTHQKVCCTIHNAITH